MPDRNTPAREQAASQSVSEKEPMNSRELIGRRVTYFALTVTGLLGLTAILVAILTDDKEILPIRFAYVKDILAIILPLVGTWVGTVLAFYFGQDNFAAAAQQTASLVKQLTPEQKLQSISAADVMIKMDDSNTKKLLMSKKEEADSKKLRSDIIEGILDKFSRNRLPIVDESGKVLYVLHRSFIDKFVSQKAGQPDVKVADLTLTDLLAAEEYRNAFLSFGTVGKSASLLSAKEAMDRIPNCSDVFVTEDGSKNTRTVGWITNAIVTENAKL
jgi:hypothetical protein